MSELIGIARFVFHPGKVDEFKQLTARCVQIVRERDPGTLHYDVYFNADQSEAVVIEHYADSDALIAHLANIGDQLMADITATAHVTGETLGEPSDQLRTLLADTPVRLFAPYESA